MGYQYSERIRRPLAFTILLFLGITLTFTILAVSLHNLYQADVVFPDDSGTMVRLMFTVGAFTICEDLDGRFGDPNNPSYPLSTVSVHSCARVTPTCKLRGMVILIDGQEYDNVADDNFAWNCPSWNAFRAFFIMSIIATAISLVTTLLYTKRTMDWGASVSDSMRYYYISLSCMIFSAICLIIAWATAASVIADVDPDNEIAKHGPAFGLAVTAWVTQVLALMGFITYYLSDPNRKAKNMDSVVQSTS